MTTSDLKEEWRVYMQLNAAANAAYANEVSNHGRGTLPHPCGKPDCKSANSNYRNLARRLEADDLERLTGRSAA